MSIVQMGAFQHWYWNTPIDRHWLTTLWPGFSPSWFRHLNMFSYGSSWILAQSLSKKLISAQLSHSITQSLSSITQQKTQFHNSAKNSAVSWCFFGEVPIGSRPAPNGSSGDCIHRLGPGLGGSPLGSSHRFLALKKYQELTMYHH